MLRYRILVQEWKTGPGKSGWWPDGRYETMDECETSDNRTVAAILRGIADRFSHPTNNR